MFNLLYANFYVKPGDGGNGSNAFNISLFNKKYIMEEVVVMVVI